MDVTVTISYEVQDEDINTSISEILDRMLPYMVDNLDIYWEIKDGNNG